MKNEKTVSSESLEALLGMDVIAMWIDFKQENVLNDSKLYFRVFDKNRQVEMTMVWKFHDIECLKALDLLDGLKN